MSLDVEVRRRIHGGLTIDAGLAVADACGVLFGPSGAGKTSLLRMIAGLDRPESGRVRVGGRALFDSAGGVDLRLRDRGVGVVFQDDLLFPHLDVAANVRFGLKGRPAAAARARSAEVAALCGIGPLMGRRVASLSGGERQRVGLARAIAPRPRALLCDEPISALDLDARSAMIALLRSVRRVESIPILLVTHAPAEAVAFGDVLFLMDRGRVVDRGPPLDVLAGRPGPAAPLDGLINSFAAVVSGRSADAGETRLSIVGGPDLIVPLDPRPVGSPTTATVRADEILVARGREARLSARNLLPATVDRVVPHGPLAEVIARTGDLAWIASVTASAVRDLEIAPGAEVTLVVKARSCRVSDRVGID